MMSENDKLIFKLLQIGRLVADSKTGYVYSKKSNTPTKPIGSKTNKGYLRTSVNLGSKDVRVMIHRVACIAFHGMPLGENKFVNHKNGIKTDNRPQNLEWVTADENIKHAMNNGLLRPVKCEDHYAAKLTFDDVREIRASNLPTRLLSSKYGVSTAQIRRIKRNERWNNLPVGRKHSGRVLDGKIWEGVTG